MRLGIRNLVPALAAALLLAVPATSQAMSTLVTESIVDIGFFSTDLERVRTEGLDITTESNDGTIIAENNLVNFSSFNTQTTSWTHDLKSWLSFTPASYSDVLLVIAATGTDNPDDIVEVDEIVIGSLNDTFFGVSVTLFSGATLDAQVSDNGMLDVEITKTGDSSSIFEATLTAKVAPVPEPSGVLLFGVGSLLVRTAVRKRLS